MGDVTALLRACLVAIRLPADAAGRHQPPRPPFWSPVWSTAAEIRALLPATGQGGAPLAALLPELPAAERTGRCREAVAGTFAAGLELARGGDVTLYQQAPWQPIQVRPGQEPGSGTAGAGAG